ncbi:hypothetical protein QL285_016335 [Trifolium repens]|nr:hypothetical protein QL285_016335 [Trifolium repens]
MSNIDSVGEVNIDDQIEIMDEVDLDEDEMVDVGMPIQMQVLNHAKKETERRQHIGSVVVLCQVVHALHLNQILSTCLYSRVTYSPQSERRRLKDTIRSTVEEQVAKFLHIIGHNVKTRTVSFFFNRSRETVSRHFHNVLHAILALGEEFLVQPSSANVPPQILNNSRFYPYFKDCIGAIDGTHIRVKFPRAEAPRFRGRKEHPTQNILAACNFDMKFTYVLAGWEGTASDSRILKDALTKQDPLIIPEGKFYLGDAGFMLKRGLLTPYRGVCYHLKEYSSRGPQNARELFNLRHSSLRNVIERTFGVLKKRFPIIASGTEPHYSFEVMIDIVLACCIIHNFLMGVDIDEDLIAEVDRELLQNDIDRSQTQQRDEDYRLGSILRETITAEMWNLYGG